MATNNDDSDDEHYFQSLQRCEAELAASKRKTFAMLLRLFGYMAQEWYYYSICFSFLLLYSGTRIFVPYLTGEVVGSVFGEGASYERLRTTVGWMALLSISSAIFGGFRGGKV